MFYLNFNPEPTKNFEAFDSPKKEVAETRSTLVITRAENIETAVPNPSTRANPSTEEVPNQKRIMALIIVEILPSLIAPQA